mgnify:CR=1 FL=1
MEEALAGVLGVKAVTDLRRLSGGASRDTFALVADGRPLILQRQRVAGARDFVTESALTTRIKMARRALGDDGQEQRYIRTVHRRGYEFVGVVQAVPEATSAPVRPERPSPAPTVAPPDATPPSRIGRWPGPLRRGR